MHSLRNTVSDLLGLRMESESDLNNRALWFSQSRLTHRLFWNANTAYERISRISQGLFVAFASSCNSCFEILDFEKTMSRAFICIDKSFNVDIIAPIKT